MRNIPGSLAVGFACAALAAGCGSGSGEYSVAGAIGGTQGFILESASVVAISGTGPGDSDFFLDVTELNVTLRAASGAGFCSKDGTFTDVLDIPADTAGCSWGDLRIGDAEPDSAVVAQGDGYLVRDRTQLFVYRLRIVGSDYDDSGIATVYFDLASVEDDGG